MKRLKIILYFLLYAFYLFAQDNKKIILGIDRIQEFSFLFKNKKTGLITNQTGINSAGESSIDILFKNVKLTALFSPEHGIRGAEPEGAIIENRIDSKTGDRKSVV